MNDYEKEHADLLRQYGAECAVLLKSDRIFPLKAPCKLALYGSGARRTIKGGTGSGEVNSRYFVTAEAGLEAAGFCVTSKEWMDQYEKLYTDARKRFVKDLKRAALKRGTLAIIDSMGAVMPEPDYELPMAAEGDAAIYVLSRISGEGSDRKPVSGDILLTETEKRDILKLNETYRNFLLVLNVGGVIDLSPITEVRNILLLSQLGVETGNILADIVLGKSVPSGKLTTTWAAWNDYPTIGEFGEKNDTRYNEGVYVGYRYFDSVASGSMFPFGFGLSYAEFNISEGAVTAERDIVNVSVLVKNIGDYIGKEVVQLYVSAPQGKLDKPYQALAAFQKTDDLKPGETESVHLSFDLKDLASYDESRAAWILERGDYVLRLGASSRDTGKVAIVRLESEVLIKQVKNCLGKPDFTDWKPARSRNETLSSLPVVKIDPTVFTTERPDYGKTYETDPELEALTEEELCLLSIGAFKRRESKSVIGAAAQLVAGAAGETFCLSEGRLPVLILADGPAGLRLSRQYTRDQKGVHAIGGAMPESVMELMPAPAALGMKLFGGKKKTRGKIYEQNCSAIPIGTALAQSWNLTFAEMCGDIIGDEMERFGVHLWLAPALNIHRSIRCGRNFEYYSEDPLISGKFAAAITAGVQKHPGCGTTIKHFAANNQETNRYNNNSLVSERAMREIYLRGFEITVKESQPHALMTSYNLINGIHTSERYDLIEDILRAEFGFQGIVMTDWLITVMTGRNSKYAAPNAAEIAAAGNDLTMPGRKGDYKAMRKGLKDGQVTRKQLLIHATRLIRIARKLNRK